MSQAPERPGGWPRNNLTYRAGEICRTGNEWCTVGYSHPHGADCDLSCPCRTDWHGS